MTARVALSTWQRMSALVMDALPLPVLYVPAALLANLLSAGETSRWPQPVPPFPHNAIFGILEVVGLTAVFALEA